MPNLWQMESGSLKSPHLEKSRMSAVSYFHMLERNCKRQVLQVRQVKLSPDNKTLVDYFFAFPAFEGSFHVPGQSLRQAQSSITEWTSLFLPFWFCNNTFVIHMIFTSFLFLYCKSNKVRYSPDYTAKMHKTGKKVYVDV